MPGPAVHPAAEKSFLSAGLLPKVPLTAAHSSPAQEYLSLCHSLLNSPPMETAYYGVGRNNYLKRKLFGLSLTPPGRFGTQINYSKGSGRSRSLLYGFVLRFPKHRFLRRVFAGNQISTVFCIGITMIEFRGTSHMEANPDTACLHGRIFPPVLPTEAKFSFPGCSCRIPLRWIS